MILEIYSAKICSSLTHTDSYPPLHPKVFNTPATSEELPEKSSQSTASDRHQSTGNELSESETFEKMNQHLAYLEALSFNCGACQKLGLDYRAHLVHHTKPSSQSAGKFAAAAFGLYRPLEITF